MTAQVHPCRTGEPTRHTQGGFSPEARAKRILRSSSNTGQKVGLSAPRIDWCTVVLDAAGAKAFCRRRSLTEVLHELFAPGADIAVGVLRDVSCNYYPRSACLTDCTGAHVGKVAVRDDGAVQVMLSGQGVQYVMDWNGVADGLDMLGGRLSRVDIAVDDLGGGVIDLHRFKQLLADGAFTNKGRPPSAQFVDDLGSGKGCTLYIGQRGHKQLCVYEKGRALGDPTSRHMRCELRLYGKRFVLPNDVLRRPGPFFAGAYAPLGALVGGELDWLQVKEAVVQAHAVGMVRAVRRQSGRSLGLLHEALGESAPAFLAAEVLRKGRPDRFRGIPGDLPELVRQQLRHAETSGCEVAREAE